MDDDSSTPPQLPQLESESHRSMGGSSTSTPPQVSPLEIESRRSMGGSSTSTPPQLSPLEIKSRRSIGGSSTSTPQQLSPLEIESRRSIGGSSTSTPPQLRPNFINILQEVESMHSPPLGLKLEKTPELLATLRAAAVNRAGQPPEDVSKFPVNSISIGPTWRRESRREDDLTLNLYLAKKKLTWEFLEGPLKEKIEVSWSDITAIQAHVPHRRQPGVLQIQLGKKPLFFRETPSQLLPTTHTNWEATSDFTVVGDALYHRIHEAVFAQGAALMYKFYPTLLLLDERLLELSMDPFPANPSLHGESAPHSSNAPCLPSTSVNNPTPSTSAFASQSHLNPIPLTTAVGVGERSFHMLQGESSSSSSRNAETPLHNQPLPEENIAAHDQAAAAPINSLSTLEGSNIDAGDQQ